MLESRAYIFQNNKLIVKKCFDHFLSLIRHWLYFLIPINLLQFEDICRFLKVHLAKAVVFPVVMYGCESWTVRKLNAEELMLLNCGVGEDS